MEGEQHPADQSSDGSGTDPNQLGEAAAAATPAPLPPPPTSPPPYAAPQMPPAPHQPPPYQPPPYQPPVYQPPQVYAAPGAPATYAPPIQPGYGEPMQPGFAPPPAKTGSRTLLIVGLVAVFLVIVLAVGGFLANLSLSATYGPGRAVTDYLAAQSRGDVPYMVANANFLKGDSSKDAFFGQAALTAMMAISDNKAVSGVTVSSTQQIDSSTSKVTVSMSWSGNQRTQTYTVHKDSSRQHFVFYNDWKLDIPASTIAISLPNQAGAVQIDDVGVPAGTTSLSVIQGYHAVTMAKTDLYDQDNQTANAVEGAASVTFAGKLSANALTAAKTAVQGAFNNITCDASKYFDCPGHVYHPSAGHYDILPMPGGDVNAYSSWVLTITGDPSANMTLTPTTTAGQVKASGTCTSKLVVDGKTTINYSGTWDGTLTFSGGSAGSDIVESCDNAKA